MIKKVMLQPSPPNSGSIGSTLKCIGLARVLQSKGCKVCFVIGGKLKKLVEKEGFKCYDFPLPKTKRNQQNINSLVDFLEWTGMTDEDYVQKSIITEINAIKDFNPNVIFSETRLSSCISSKICEVPLMSVAAWPCHPDFPSNIADYGRNTKIYNEILDKYCLEKIDHLAELLFLRSDVKISPSIPELEPELTLIQNVTFMGYVLDVTLKEKITPKKDIVLVYFSVGAINPQLYYDVITETFGDAEEQVIVACGYHYSLDNNLSSKYKNIHFVQYLNLSDIIHRVKLIIFHGGQDTMMMSLLYGIPSIAIPGQHFERKYNSSALAKLGTSEQLPVYAFRPNRLKKAIKDCCSIEKEEKCNYWKQIMSQYQGTLSCADFLISLC